MNRRRFKTSYYINSLNSKAMAKKVTLIPNEVNVMSGKDLTEMGYFIDSDGFLIATTLKYNVIPRPPHQGGWSIRQKNKTKQV